LITAIVRFHCFAAVAAFLARKGLVIRGIESRVGGAPFLRTFFGREVWLFALLFLCIRCEAQMTITPAATTETAKAAETDNTEQVPRVPGVTSLFRGFNAGLSFAQVHDSSSGWYNLITPAFSYRISKYYSVDASLSIYPYRRVQEESSPGVQQTQLAVRNWDVGDTLIGTHASFDLPFGRNTFTGAFTIPTGNRSADLGTGRVTFDFSDHLEHYVKQTGFIFDVGGGDSSGLFNRIVSNDETSLGAAAHFQTGLVVFLPWSSHIQSVAYELLPIGSQKVFPTVSAPGAPVSPVIAGSGISEDNGFTTSMGVPLTDHLIVGGYYNRSLRQHTDTVSFGMTYVLRGTLRRMSLIDRALREAEGASK
jgi:hypothetical protein